jgi:hypothetical protein
MENIKTETHNNLNDSVEGHSSFCNDADSGKANSYPYYKIDEEAVHERFVELKKLIEEQRITQNEKAASTPIQRTTTEIHLQKSS